MIYVNYDEKVINLLKKLKAKGLKRSSCLAIAVIIMTNGGSTTNLNSKNVQELNETSQYEVTSIAKTTSKAGEIAVEIPKEPTNEEKIAEILARENITREQFDEIVATVIGEAAPGSYEDAYAVINTFYNRKISKIWINEVLKVTDIDNGDNLYAQITLINQSEVYTSGRYKEFLGVTDVPAYQATIDFLYTLEPMHNYLCFFASYGDKEGREQFVDGGNLYYSVLLDEDRVAPPTTLTRKP